MEKADQRQLNWALLLGVVAGGSVVLLSLMVYSPYGDLLYILPIAPIVCLVCLLLMVASAIRKRPRQCLSALLALAVFVAATGVILVKKDSIRAYARWLLWSQRYKAEVLAQAAPASGELRHMEWEATGFAGVANNTFYLVFDPTDLLLPAARSHSPGKYSGIPCEVLLVRRLESHWYSVRFYTDEAWGQRNQLNCSGFGQ
jgi:hypothetical protein